MAIYQGDKLIVNGSSTYASVKEAGYQGTEAEFYEMLANLSDQTPESLGAAPVNHTHPAEDVGARPNTWVPTATDVGLGNVPNVATNNQTPTYTAASSNANLTSGEKLSVAFGKIAKAISSLISHLADTTSHITSAERTTWNGKANASHGTHVTYGTSASALGTSSAGSATTVSRSDHVHALPALTSCTGTLSVAKGGTGKTSWTANRLMYPSAATTMNQLAFPTVAGSVLRQGTSGAPYWTSLADLATALGGSKIETGSYSGTGYSETVGNNTVYKRSLTFSFVPKLVIIAVEGTPKFSHSSFAMWLGGSFLMNAIEPTASAVQPKTNAAATLSNKTLSWQSYYVEAMFDNSGQTFRYVAFG